jgi:hypothetical protein
MDARESIEARTLGLLREIAGVHAVERLSAEQLTTVCEQEARFESSSVIPIRNLGLRLLSRRDACFVVLKDERFRPPNVPTVYLVEAGAEQGSAHGICVEGTWYRVVGEEIIKGRAAPVEPVIHLGASFVIYPERRGSPQVPCSFILPPIAFPELEARTGDWGVSSVISISPSLAVDGYLRTAFDFPPTNALATLLVGYNMPRSA